MHDGEMIIRLSVLVELRLVTDGRTNGRTQGHSVTALAQRRAVIKTKTHYCSRFVIPIPQLQVQLQKQNSQKNETLQTNPRKTEETETAYEYV